MNNLDKFLWSLIGMAIVLSCFCTYQIGIANAAEDCIDLNQFIYNGEIYECNLKE